MSRKTYNRHQRNTKHSIACTLEYLKEMDIFLDSSKLLSKWRAQQLNQINNKEDWERGWGSLPTKKSMPWWIHSRNLPDFQKRSTTDLSQTIKKKKKEHPPNSYKAHITLPPQPCKDTTTKWKSPMDIPNASILIEY